MAIVLAPKLQLCYSCSENSQTLFKSQIDFLLSYMAPMDVLCVNKWEWKKSFKSDYIILSLQINLSESGKNKKETIDNQCF